MRFTVYRTDNIPDVPPFEKLMTLDQDCMDDATDEFIATCGEEVEIDCIHEYVTVLTTDTYIYQVVENECEDYMLSHRELRS
jgi:hypothetical protein